MIGETKSIGDTPILQCQQQLLKLEKHSICEKLQWKCKKASASDTDIALELEEFPSRSRLIPLFTAIDCRCSTRWERDEEPSALVCLTLSTFAAAQLQQFDLLKSPNVNVSPLQRRLSKLELSLLLLQPFVRKQRGKFFRFYRSKVEIKKEM